MTERSGASWIVYALGVLCAGAIAAAILVVGPASGSQGGQTRTATAAQGVVQSTVSGSGNLQPASQLNLGFKTSGTVTHIYVTQGEQVAKGQLLATLNPQSAEVALEQARASLQSAEANLAKEEETGGEGSAGSSAGNGSTGSSASVRYETPLSAGNATSASTSALGEATAQIATAIDASYERPGPTGVTAPEGRAPSGATVPSGTSPTSNSNRSAPGRTGTSTAPTNSTAPPNGSSNHTRGARESEPREPSSSPNSGSSSSPSSSKPNVSPATREANLASANAAVKSDKLTVQSAEQAVQDTKLYAPQDGTIVSLAGQVGEVVSANGTTRASSSSSSSGGSGSSGAGAAGAASALRPGAGAGSTSGSGSTGSSGSSGSGFAVLSDLGSLQLVAPLSESEIGSVKDGQIATVSVEALEGRKLAAHVSEVALLSTTNSGVVSYDVTFRLDQMEAGLKTGMSATAEVVVKQEEGVNVPTSAITAGAVTVIENGKHVRRRVVTGLAGNSSTIILSGLNAGEKVALPVAATTPASSGLRGLGGRGGLGGGGGGLGGLGGAGLLLRGAGG